MIGQYLDQTVCAEETARSMSFYTEAQMQALVAEFNVPLELTDRFAAQLQTAAERWFVWRQRRPVDVADTREALVDLSKSISAVTKKMRSMPDEVWRVMGDSPQWFDIAPDEYRIDGTLLEDEAFKEVILSVEVGPRYVSHSASVAEIVAMLDALSEHAHLVEQIEGQYHGQRGPNRDLAFNEWARLIRSIWSSMLGREFTYDAKGGQAISDAAQFCWAAFSPLDDRHTEKETVRKLRSFIEFERRNNRLHK